MTLLAEKESQNVGRALQNKGLIIVLEGTDGSGKKTQSELLYSKLKEMGEKVRLVEFPRYDKPSSENIKKYLRGDFGEDASKVEPRQASTYFSEDRKAAFDEELYELYEAGWILIFDRYTTSNMLHQATKLECKEERESFLNWLEHHEFVELKLPRPDKVFFLKTNLEVTKRIVEERDNKFTNEKELDIHERDSKHLQDAINRSDELVERYGWELVNCIENNELKTIESIHQDIMDSTLQILKEKSN